MVDIQTVSIIMASASVMAGIVYYSFQIRHQTRIRKTDLVIRLWSRMQRDDFIDATSVIRNLKFRDYEEFAKQYGPFGHRTQAGQEVNKALVKVCAWCDMVGTLLCRKHIDLNLVYDVFGVYFVKEVYEKTKPLTVAIRKEKNDPSHMIGFEYLYNELLRKEPQLWKTFKKAYVLTDSNPNLSNQSSGVRNG
jgi:hypothetical protein